jgi:hypothetical protein
MIAYTFEDFKNMLKVGDTLLMYQDTFWKKVNIRRKYRTVSRIKEDAICFDNRHRLKAFRAHYSIHKDEFVCATYDERPNTNKFDICLRFRTYELILQRCVLFRKNN